ncbi:MAG: sister chromatid cohesion protein PDS5 [Gemmatimonadetes bacterium]|nr:sister chromatid cohesion protein PDS5 [Gemmatimonadota bacterium]
MSESARFQLTVRELLSEDQTRATYHEMRTRVQDMGPEVDAVLLALARDRAVNLVVRSNALVLLAERRAPGAFSVLERALRPDQPARLRAAAVLGLQRLLAVTPDAMRLIRGALQDRSRTVRLNALTALDVTDVETVRAMLERERDPEVREVAMQLVGIAEARGAPLATDRRGALRTTSSALDAQIVFRPAQADPASGLALGDLRLELPGALDVPLTSNARAMGGVVPAFFSADHAQVVFEDDGQIRVIEIPTRNIRSVGPGIAPRVIPFSNSFVFLRELPPARAAPGDEMRYSVFRAEFGGGAAEVIGELRATIPAGAPPGYSPVRRMVVAETLDGSVLRGEGITTFLLPAISGEPVRPVAFATTVAAPLRQSGAN